MSKMTVKNGCSTIEFHRAIDNGDDESEDSQQCKNLFHSGVYYTVLAGVVKAGVDGFWESIIILT